MILTSFFFEIIPDSNNPKPKEGRNHNFIKTLVTFILELFYFLMFLLPVCIVNITIDATSTQATSCVSISYTPGITYELFLAYELIEWSVAITQKSLSPKVKP